MIKTFKHRPIEVKAVQLTDQNKADVINWLMPYDEKNIKFLQQLIISLSKFFFGYQWPTDKLKSLLAHFAIFD